MKRIFISILIALLGLPTFGIAKDLVLIDGKGKDVCEMRLKNLNKLTLNDMICNRLKSPSIKGFRKPAWVKMNLKDNKELVRKIEKFFMIGNQDGKDESIDNDGEFEDYVTTVLRSNYLLVSDLDIDNDGRTEKVCLYNDRLCLFTFSYARPLLVIDNNMKHVDLDKTEPLLQNRFAEQHDIKGKAVNYLFQIYDVFIFQNVTYFDNWDVAADALTVYTIAEGQVKQVCKYKYGAERSRPKKKRRD
jgi:hypothetical protein